MVNSIARNIPDNFIRNGNFATGTLEFWEPPVNFVSYVIQPDPLNPGTYELYGLGRSGFVLTSHADFIPVNDGEVANLNFTDAVPAGAYSYITLNCYDANYSLLQYMFTDEYTGDGNPNSHSKRLRIPPGTAFIKLIHNAGTGNGGYVTLKGVSLRLEHNTEALNGIVDTKIIPVTDPETVSAGTSKDITISPADPDVAYKVIGFELSMGAVAATGSGVHGYWLLTKQADGAEFTYIYNSAAYNSGFSFTNFIVTSTGGSPQPSDVNAIIKAIQSIIITADRPLIIRYKNNTGTAMTKTRTYKVLVQVIKRNNAVNFG